MHAPLLAAALDDVDVQYVWRFLRARKIDLAGRKSWCESNDPAFVAKAADVVGLYMAPPENSRRCTSTLFAAFEVATGKISPRYANAIRPANLQWRPCCSSRAFMPCRRIGWRMLCYNSAVAPWRSICRAGRR
jgi:hypothetical protein